MNSIVAVASKLIDQLWENIRMTIDNEKIAVQLYDIKEVIDCIGAPFLTQKKVDKFGH